MELQQEYDYVIVGGGTAGSVVAARLAEQPDTSVCLIEAGPTDEGKAEILAVKNWPNLLGTEFDYDYSIEQQARGNIAGSQPAARIKTAPRRRRMARLEFAFTE